MTVPNMLVPSWDSLAFTATPGYEMGYTNSDGTTGRQRWMYNATGAATVVGRCYIETYDGDEETDHSIVVLDSVATNQRLLVVARQVVASGAWGWFATWGIVDAFVVGTTDVAKDDYLKAPTSFTAALAYSLIKDGTAETINSVAIATIANTVDTVGTLCRIKLLGKNKVISA